MIQTTLDGQSARFDEEDAEMVSSAIWLWRAVGGTGHHRLVRYETIRNAKGTRTVVTHQLHREMLGCKPYDGHVSFADGDARNLCRSNLVVHVSTHNRRDCPFSLARLREMYLAKSMSALAIARAASEMLGERVGPWSVFRWLSEAEIPARDMGEWLTMMVRRHPAKYAEYRAYGSIVHAEKARNGEIATRVDHLHTPATKRKAKTAWKKNHDRDNTILCVCRYVPCSKVFRRSKCEIARRPQAFCSRECLYASMRKSEEHKIAVTRKCVREAQRRYRAKQKAEGATP